MFRNTYAYIDLGNIRHNVGELRKNIGDTGIMAVVKADAYGHGAVPVARAALEEGVAWLGVATPEEALELRENGIDAPILVLGLCERAAMEEMVLRQVSMGVCHKEEVEWLEKISQGLGRQAKVHLKVDSGMGRIGIRGMEELREFLDTISRAKNVLLEGLYTHFATADETDKAYSYRQLEQFRRIKEEVEKQGFRPIVHAANSAAAVEIPEAQFDMVRQGITLYGCYPSEFVDKTKMQLRQAMSLIAHIVHIKTIEPGETVSYGRKFRAKRPTVVATLEIGYADGYRRAFTNQAEALVHGQRVPVIGTVCMDQIMLDVTEIDAPQIGDEAVLLGQQGEERISTQELAEIAETITYEIMTSISKRVPRVYQKK